MEKRTIKRIVTTGILTALGGLSATHVESAPDMEPSAPILEQATTDSGLFIYTEDGKRFATFAAPKITSGEVVDASVESCINNGTTLETIELTRIQPASDFKSVHYRTQETPASPLCEDGQITPLDASL